MEGVGEVKWMLCYSAVCCYRRGVRKGRGDKSFEELSRFLDYVQFFL